MWKLADFISSFGLYNVVEIAGAYGVYSLFEFSYRFQGSLKTIKKTVANRAPNVKTRKWSADCLSFVLGGFVHLSAKTAERRQRRVSHFLPPCRSTWIGTLAQFWRLRFEAPLKVEITALKVTFKPCRSSSISFMTFVVGNYSDLTRTFQYVGRHEWSSNGKAASPLDIESNR